MSNRTKVYVYVHTHWDREWYRTFQQYRLKLIEVIDLILEQFEKGELEYFTLDGQSIVIEDYLEVKPENRDKIIHHIKEGRLDIGPWLVLPDEFLVSGESIVNNILLGHKMSSKYGITNKVGYIPDTFGHSIDIPLILRKFNIDNAIMWRGIKTEHTGFKWKSLDNSWVKAYHLLDGYYTNIFEKEEGYNIETKASKLKDFINKIKAKTDPDYILFPVGGDHRPPPENITRQIREINEAQSEYELIQTTLENFLKLINPEKLIEEVQYELRDCSNAYILPAVYSSRLYLKRHNARLTNKINGLIEPLTCFCNTHQLDNFRLPDSEYLWKLLILNHPHDSICGCSIDEVHDEMEQRFKELHQACDELVYRASFAIMKHVPQGEIGVFNASSFPYTGPVKLNRIDQKNHNLPSQIIRTFKDRHFRFYSDLEKQLPATEIPEQTEELIWAENIAPHSLKIVKPATIPNPVTYRNNRLSNGLIELQVNSNSITLKDLQTGQEYPGINQIIDRRDSGDTYNFGPVKGDQPVIARITSSKITESGPIRGILNIVYEIEIPEYFDDEQNKAGGELIRHKIYCDVSMTANSKLVEFNLNWINMSKDHLLQVKFPVENDIYSVLTENHFCAIERRFDPHYNIYDQIPAEKLTELKTNTAAMQRFIQANELAVFTEGLPEYEVYKNFLYITILRATGFLSKGMVTTRGAYAGPKLPTNANQCLGHNSVRYAVHPKTTVPDLYMLSEIFMGCTVCVEGIKEGSENITEKGLVNWDNPNIISSCYKAGNATGEIILHLLNVTAYPQVINFNFSLNIENISEINFLNEPLEDLQINTRIIFSPHELKGILVKLHTC